MNAYCHLHKAYILAISLGGALVSCAAPLSNLCESDAVVMAPSPDQATEAHVRSLLVGSRLRTTGNDTPTTCAPPNLRGTRSEDFGSSCAVMGQTKAAERLSARESRVFVGKIDDNRYAAWVFEARFPDGRVGGRVGLLESVDGRLRVRALGYLVQGAVAPTFETIAVGASELLIVRSSRCEHRDGQECARYAVPLLMAGERIEPLILEEHDGTCVLGGAFLVEARVQQEVRTGPVELVYGGSLVPSRDGLVVRETLQTTERNVENSELPTATTHLDEVRTFSLSSRGDRLRADRPSLLSAALGQAN